MSTVIPSTNIWLIAAPTTPSSAEAQLETLKSRVGNVSTLNVPQNLKFSTFDQLIKLTDDLAKYDGNIESVLRRLERSLLDVDSSIIFSVQAGRQEMKPDEYVCSFAWDDAKFPRTRPLAELLLNMTSAVQRLDEEAKTRTTSLQELKQQNNAINKPQQSSLVSRDLVEVLTPGEVDASLFVYTEHLTTVVVVVSRAGVQEFMNTYTSLSEWVVPESAIVLPGTDKEGNKLYRLVVFKKDLENFKQNARTARITVRDFVYDATKFDELLSLRSSLGAELKKSESLTKRILAAAYSDCLVCLMHIKAVRVFVEAVLRWGIPVSFAAFTIKPTKTAKVRAELAKIYENISGTGGSSNATASSSAGEGDDETDAFFPYVYFPFLVNLGGK